MLATTAVAQVNTNKLPAIPAPVIAASPVAAPAAPAVAAKPEAKKAAPVKHKKKPVAKPAAPAPAAADKATDASSTLVLGSATVRADNANLRGQAGLKGEVVGQVKKGETLTVISLINLDKPKAGEPAHWAKVALPAGLKVWVNAKFIDATNKVVYAKKLNLRAGPGENYSVLGVVEKGAEINSLSSKGDWLQIAAPTNAFAFVSASLLKQDAAAPAPVIPPAPATTSLVPDAQPIVSQPAPVPPAAVPAAPSPVAPPIAAPAPTAPAPAVLPNLVPEIVDTNPPPPRVVSHEGYVRPSVSVVAPTYYELYDPGTSVAINYLYPPTTNLNVARYNGLHIVVTGEEGLDSRWRDTPMLKIQKIYVLSTNAPSAKKP